MTGGVTELIESGDTEEADHPASTPRPFTDEEKAWGAALFHTRKWFTKNALKDPPVPTRNQAQALGLIPLANGLLFSDKRAARLHALIAMMSLSERATFTALAQERLQQWQEQHAMPDSDELQQEQSSSPPEPNAQLLWKLPHLDEMLPRNEELIQQAEKAQACQSAEAQRLAQMLQQTLDSYHVRAEVRPAEISFGPTVVRLAIRPTGIPETRPDARDKSQQVIVRDGHGNIIYKQRTKSSSILARQNDIALCLEAEHMRMQAPVPGRPYVGVEIPNKHRRIVTLREILESKEYQAAARKSKLTVALGKDVTNQVRLGDLSRMPHLLIAGSTGSGKSVCLNAILACILMQATPDDVRLLMVDPKMVELSLYDGIPHLLSPVVTDVEKVVPLLQHAVKEMERRYRLFSELHVRNLDGYRKLRQERLAQTDISLPNLPAIAIIIDELADLMLAIPEEIEGLIQRLTQLARATGIHLVIATQRPSVDVITGVIKANLRTRISFMVSSAVNSRTILGMGGAEQLIGRGDMLYQPEDSRNPERIQGTYIEDEEVTALVQYWRDAWARHTQDMTNTSLEIDNAVQLTLPSSEFWHQSAQNNSPQKLPPKDPSGSQCLAKKHFSST